MSIVVAPILSELLLSSFLKYITLFQDTEYIDERQHCFMLHTGVSDTHYMCPETKQELLKIENGWHRATYNAVTRLGVISH